MIIIDHQENERTNLGLGEDIFNTQFEKNLHLEYDEFVLKKKKEKEKNSKGKKKSKNFEQILLVRRYWNGQ